MPIPSTFPRPPSTDRTTLFFYSSRLLLFRFSFLRYTLRRAQSRVCLDISASNRMKFVSIMKIHFVLASLAGNWLTLSLENILDNNSPRIEYRGTSIFHGPARPHDRPSIFNVKYFLSRFSHDHFCSKILPIDPPASKFLPNLIGRLIIAKCRVRVKGNLAIRLGSRTSKFAFIPLDKFDFKTKPKWKLVGISMDF